MISQARLSCMASAVGWLWRPSLCWAHEPAVTAIAERRSRPRRSRGWHWAAGFCALVGSVSVVSAQSLEGVSGLVAVNSLMAMVGGILAALIVGRADPGFVHNGALAGLVAVCAGSDVMHPIGSLITGGGRRLVRLFLCAVPRAAED